MTAIFHLSAQLEFEEALEGYREQGWDLANSFKRAVQEASSDIEQFPEAYPVEFTPLVRRKNVERFPYYLAYVIEPDAIAIIAVAHVRRQPLYWIRRV